MQSVPQGPQIVQAYQPVRVPVMAKEWLPKIYCTWQHVAIFSIVTFVKIEVAVECESGL
jgi:hypothetical protein